MTHVLLVGYMTGMHGIIAPVYLVVCLRLQPTRPKKDRGNLFED